MLWMLWKLNLVLSTVLICFYCDVKIALTTPPLRNHWRPSRLRSFTRVRPTLSLHCTRRTAITKSCTYVCNYWCNDVKIAHLIAQFTLRTLYFIYSSPAIPHHATTPSLPPLLSIDNSYPPSPPITVVDLFALHTNNLHYGTPITPAHSHRCPRRRTPAVTLSFRLHPSFTSPSHFFRPEPFRSVRYCFPLFMPCYAAFISSTLSSRIPT